MNRPFRLIVILLALSGTLFLSACNSSGGGSTSVYHYEGVYGGYSYPYPYYGYDDDDVEDYIEHREDQREDRRDRVEERRENRPDRAGVQRGGRQMGSMGRPSRMPRRGGGRRR